MNRRNILMGMGASLLFPFPSGAIAYDSKKWRQIAVHMGANPTNWPSYMWGASDPIITKMVYHGTDCWVSYTAEGPGGAWSIDGLAYKILSIYRYNWNDLEWDVSKQWWRGDGTERYETYKTYTKEPS